MQNEELGAHFPKHDAMSECRGRPSQNKVGHQGTCTQTHRYTKTHTHKHTHTHTNTHTHTHTNAHTNTDTHTHTNAHTRTQIHTHAHTHTHRLFTEPTTERTKPPLSPGVRVLFCFCCRAPPGRHLLGDAEAPRGAQHPESWGSRKSHGTCASFNTSAPMIFAQSLSGQGIDIPKFCGPLQVPSFGHVRNFSARWHARRPRATRSK